MMFYGFFVIVFSLLLTIVVKFFDTKKEEYKWWRKHLKKRKGIIFWLALGAGVLLLSETRNVFSETVQLSLWGIHALVLFGYVFWVSHLMYYDYTRIQRAIRRSNKK